MYQYRVMVWGTPNHSTKEGESSPLEDALSSVAAEGYEPFLITTLGLDSQGYDQGVMCLLRRPIPPT